MLLAILLTAGVLSAAADVGLPDYIGPEFPSVEDQGHPLQAFGRETLARPISAKAALACGISNAKQQDRSALDFAAPGDFRPALHIDSAGTASAIPLIISGKRALLQAGKLINKAEVMLSDGGLLLVSSDEGFFNSLKGIQIGDRLLVHTSHTLRQYTVTRARITQQLSRQDGDEESLSLVACYPFQAIGSKPIFYELRAQALQASHQDAKLTQKNIAPDLINF